MKKMKMIIKKMIKQILKESYLKKQIPLLPNKLKSYKRNLKFEERINLIHRKIKILNHLPRKKNQKIPLKKRNNQNRKHNNNNNNKYKKRRKKKMIKNKKIKNKFQQVIN